MTQPISFNKSLFIYFLPRIIPHVPSAPTLLNGNNVLNQLYVEREIAFQNAAMNRSKVERKTQPSSNPSSSWTERSKNTKPLTGEAPQYQIPRLFALIIGINVYQMNHRTLRGAVPDGKAFKNYLMNRLCVPESHIISLFDRYATRTKIIEGFRKLRDNKDINEGDPIFIFYAGHGSQKRAHPDWALEDRKVKTEDHNAQTEDHDVQMQRRMREVILPHDCDAVNEEYPEGVEPIPDHTIGILIDEIAAEKGDNITVVFDCCHSASGTRSEDDDSLTLIRSAELEDVPFRKETDREIRESLSRNARPDEAHLRRSFGSHMLISACKSSQKANEYNGRGRLSTALLKLLDRDSTLPNKLRYRDILASMEPIPGQHPQCEGHAQDRLLFDGKVLLPRKDYPIRFDKDTGNYTLGAGAASGIAVNSEFTAYSDPDELLNPLGTFVVESLLQFESDMRPLTLSSTLPIQGASAIQTKEGDVEPFRLHIPPEDSFHREYHLIRASNKVDLRGVVLVNEPGKAQLMVLTSQHDGRLTFVHMDKRVTRFGMNLVSDEVESDPDIVEGVLETAARYFRELDRTTFSHEIADLIEVEFYKLHSPTIRAAGRTTLEQLKPVGPNLCHENIINFVVDTAKAPYGFKIINNAESDLYVNAFYFDNTSFAIVPYYLTNCPSGEHCKLESPLKSNGELCVGYGSGGWKPFSYELKQGQDLDVGFLKIYLSTQPVDLSGIQQESAYLGEPRTSAVWHPEPQDAWDTILIPIIQRSKPSPS